ncbi:hypothetical protein SeMB42_g01459 [Synchytrium endobioticum]|uniref:Large conductance mechanosensitive channel protein n=1 Tax=Synchytrium endobioticum TaxID=286115 RepID=A0A507DLV1_9FUNG|nr:hypothetical protein SeMB42_g01459 [Synchytrium endobioticum]
MRPPSAGVLKTEEAKRQNLTSSFAAENSGSDAAQFTVSTETEANELSRLLPDNLAEARVLIHQSSKEALATMSYFWRSFYDFVYRGPVVDLGVGIVIGSTFATIVSSLVEDILTPPFSLLFSGSTFTEWFFVLRPGNSGAWIYTTLDDAKADGAITENVGRFLNSLLTFVFVAIAMMLVVRSLQALRKRLDPGAEFTIPCPACTNSVSSLACKCPSCCTWLIKDTARFYRLPMGMKGSELGIFLKLRPFEVPPEMRDQGLSRISEAGAALVANRASSGKKRLLKRRWTRNPFRPLQSVGEVPRYTSRPIDRNTPNVQNRQC